MTNTQGSAVAVGRNVIGGHWMWKKRRQGLASVKVTSTDEFKYKWGVMLQ
jgi:hypothetical protein